MNREKIDLALYRMEKAKQTRDEAEILFQNGKFTGAMNRVYYSIFYAASALLMLEGLGSSKHSGVISLFMEHLVKKEKVPEETGMFLRDAFKLRSKGDYDDYTQFSGTQVENALVKLSGNLATLESLLKERCEE